MATSKNERNTENIVREELRKLGYSDPAKDIQIEEQKSNIEEVKKLLKTASKSGGAGQGAPEFIISSPSTPDFLLVVECKADVKDHQSDGLKNTLSGDENETAEARAKRVQRFAVDGVLHYAQKLSKGFNVIAVAVSGEKAFATQFSAFLHPKGAGEPKPMQTKDGSEIDRFLAWDDFIEHGTFDPSVARLRFDELMAFSRELHDFMRDHAKLTENQKPLLVSGTLIALQNKAFAKSYDAFRPKNCKSSGCASSKRKSSAPKFLRPRRST